MPAILTSGKKTIPRRLSASLFFCPDFSGDELKRDVNQAASSSGPANDYAAVPVPGVPCLCLTLSHNGTSTTDDFGLHFWNSEADLERKHLTMVVLNPDYTERTRLEQGN